MSAETVAWAALFVGACGASITGLVIGGKWIMRRADARDHIDTFIDAHIPENGDVARTLADNDAAAELDDVIEELAEVLPRLRRSA